jgi:4-amino-4-deoxy-L-arabinose transferase-like glycosyltransferase
MDKLVGMVRSFLPELALLLAVGLLMLLNVSAFEIDPYSEFFHIQAARESLFANRFWVPVLNGHDYLMRAPLWTWIIMGFFKLFGVSVLVARIPAILCSMLSLAFTYMLGMELTQNRFAALFSAAALATTWGFFHGGCLSTADIFATVLYTAFAWAFIQWHSFASRKTIIPMEMSIFSGGMGILLGLLVLTKGPLSVVLLLAIAASYLIINQSLSVLGKLKFSLLLGPILLIPLPWLIIASIQSGNSHFIWDFLAQQPMDRMLGAGPWSNLQPDFLYYLKHLPLDFLPYWLLIPAILLDTGLIGQRGGNQSQQPWVLWLFLWPILGLLTNSVSVFHEPTRILPLLPPLAVLAGHYLSRVTESKAQANDYGNTLVAYIGLLMLSAVLCAVVIFQVVPSDYVSGYWHLPGQDIIETLNLGKHQVDLPEAFPLWKFWLIPGPFILLIGGFSLYVLLSERRLTLTPIALIASTFAFFIFIKLLYLPIMYRPVPETFAKHLNHQVQKGDGIVLYSLHPDIKRVMFYLDPKKLARVRTVRKPELVEQNIMPPRGVMYGVIPEQDYFADLPVKDRSLLQVTHADWNWDTGNMGELKKFFIIRQPQFDLMKSKMLSFQSLPPASQAALHELRQVEAALSGEQPETGHRKKRRRR